MLLLFLLLIRSVFAAEGEISPTPNIATDSAMVSSPSATPVPTLIPTPTIDPVQQKIDQYTKDYQYNRDLYNQAYLEYINKKQIHTQYGTIITEKEKLEATRNVLIARNNMMRTYLLTLRVRLDKYISQNPTETEKLKIDINKWEAWFEEQKTVAKSLISATDFSKNAEDFKSKYTPIRRVISTALVQHQVNATRYTQSLLVPVITELSASDLKPEGQQLLSEIRVKLDLSSQSLQQALIKTGQNPNSSNFNDFYPDSKTNLIQAKDYISEVIQNLEGIIIRFTNL